MRSAQMVRSIHGCKYPKEMPLPPISKTVSTLLWSHCPQRLSISVGVDDVLDLFRIGTAIVKSQTDPFFDQLLGECNDKLPGPEHLSSIAEDCSCAKHTVSCNKWQPQARFRRLLAKIIVVDNESSVGSVSLKATGNVVASTYTTYFQGQGIFHISPAIIFGAFTATMRKDCAVIICTIPDLRSLETQDSLDDIGLR